MLSGRLAMFFFVTITFDTNAIAAFIKKQQEQRVATLRHPHRLYIVGEHAYTDLATI